ncbi:MAG TPA: hypothetical protein DCW90_17505 [Lachnospiraceae bacterium]|nr:hypothetical protein [Lachnospiraceae bacterium]
MEKMKLHKYPCSIRAISAVAILLLCLSLSSCQKDTIRMQEDFSLYEGNQEVVCVLDNRIFYFPDRVLNLYRVDVQGEANRGWLFIQDRLYFSVTYEEKKYERYTFAIYSCDLYGNQLEKVFEKEGFQTHPWARGIDGKIYWEYAVKPAWRNENRRMDAYDIATKTYTHVAEGEKATHFPTTSRYEELYKVKKYGRTFELSNISTAQILKITEDTVKNTPCGSAMETWEYRAKQVDFCDGRIFCTYQLKNTDLSSWGCPVVVMEYHPETDCLTFCLFSYLDDTEITQVITI